MKTLVALFLLFALPVASIGQSELPDIDSMSIDEIGKLPEETINRLPAIPLMQKIFAESEANSDPRMWQFLIAFQLRDLLYTRFEADEKTVEEAVRDFQGDLSQEQTGELTLGQLTELGKRFNRRRDTSVYVYDDVFVFRLEGFIQANGTWIIEGEQIAYPINTSKIVCWRDRMNCQVIQANVRVPNVDSDDTSYSLSLDTIDYEIISWGQDEVLARNSGMSNCRTNLLTINTNTNEVFEVTRNNNSEGCKLGDMTISPPLEQPRIARLVDGFDATNAYWKSRKKETRDFVSTEATERFQELSELLEAQ